VYIHQELSAELSTAPGKLHPLKCDVSKENDVIASFAWVKENLGGVDILINNAGIFNEVLLHGMYHISASKGNDPFDAMYEYNARASPQWNCKLLLLSVKLFAS
jgi:NAD(P)-dependent dehydrogenase (short-subunit alcohol dehydrogenase family)